MKWMFFLVLVALLSLPAFADSPTVKMSGQFRTRAEGNNFTDFATDRDFFTVRLRPRFNLVDPNYELIFTPQFAKTMGSPAGTSGSTTDPSLGVHEAYALFPVDSLQLSAGRMILAYGDELIIGALEWNNVGRSFDGFRARWNFAPGWLDFFAMKVNDGNTAAPTTPDQDFAGLYSHFESAPWLQTLELYVLYQKAPSGSSTTQLGAAGLRNSARNGSFDRRIEATIESGSGVPSPKDPFQVDGEIGYRFEGSLQPRLAAEAFAAGPGYNQLYPTAHKWLGYADVLGRRNVSGFHCSFELSPTQLLKSKIEYHKFNRFNSSSPVYKTDGLSPLGSAAASSSTDVGSEVDLTLSYAIAQSVSLTGGASVFLPGKFLEDSFPSRTPNFYFVQVETKF